MLLSPFDPLLWDRGRVARLFGFEALLEIFKPAPQRVYGYYCLPVLAGGTAPIQLPLALFEDGPWCPNAGHVNRFDADLLRLRRVIARVRIQSADPSLRGPAGVLFTRGGTARRGSAFLPDMEVSLEVSPRNLHPSQ